jgi:hypothetical protein
MNGGFSLNLTQGARVQFTGWPPSDQQNAIDCMAAIMVIKCVVRHAWGHELQRFRLHLLSIPYNIIVINIFSSICIAT